MHLSRVPSKGAQIPDPFWCFRANAWLKDDMSGIGFRPRSKQQPRCGGQVSITIQPSSTPGGMQGVRVVGDNWKVAKALVRAKIEDWTCILLDRILSRQHAAWALPWRGVDDFEEFQESGHRRATGYANIQPVVKKRCVGPAARPACVKRSGACSHGDFRHAVCSRRVGGRTASTKQGDQWPGLIPGTKDQQLSPTT